MLYFVVHHRKKKPFSKVPNNSTAALQSLTGSAPPSTLARLCLWHLLLGCCSGSFVFSSISSERWSVSAVDLRTKTLRAIYWNVVLKVIRLGTRCVINEIPAQLISYCDSVHILSSRQRLAVGTISISLRLLWCSRWIFLDCLHPCVHFSSGMPLPKNRIAKTYDNARNDKKCFKVP